MLSADNRLPTEDSLTAATLWVQNLLLGTVGTAVAVIAIAAFGVLMLTGRADLRRGATVIIGCFILFGAPAIASSLQALATGGEVARVDDTLPAAVVTTVLSTAPPPPLPVMSDPYAGASVPRNR